MDKGFRFALVYRDPDLIKTRISGWNGAFGGAADVYLGINDIGEATKLLEGFPKSLSDTREITFGSFGPDSAGGAIRMKFRCTDGSGHACVESMFESEHKGSSAESASFTLKIEPAAVDMFVAELRQFNLGKALVAHLKGL